MDRPDQIPQLAEPRPVRTGAQALRFPGEAMQWDFPGGAVAPPLDEIERIVI